MDLKQRWRRSDAVIVEIYLSGYTTCLYTDWQNVGDQVSSLGDKYAECIELPAENTHRSSSGCSSSFVQVSHELKSPFVIHAMSGYIHHSITLPSSSSLAGHPSLGSLSYAAVAAPVLPLSPVDLIYLIYSDETHSFPSTNFPKPCFCSAGTIFNIVLTELCFSAAVKYGKTSPLYTLSTPMISTGKVPH